MTEQTIKYDFANHKIIVDGVEYTTAESYLTAYPNRVNDVGVFSHVRSLEEAAAAKIAEIEAARDAACYANATAHGRQWQADQRSQSLLGNAIGLAQAGLPLPAEWRDANNNNMPIATLSDLLAIAGAMAAQTRMAYEHSWALKARVSTATTVAEVEAVVW